MFELEIFYGTHSLKVNAHFREFTPKAQCDKKQRQRLGNRKDFIAWKLVIRQYNIKQREKLVGLPHKKRKN